MEVCLRTTSYRVRKGRLGNLLVDDVVFPDGRTRMSAPGGAILYAALGASLWGLTAGVASVSGSPSDLDAGRGLGDRSAA